MWRDYIGVVPAVVTALLGILGIIFPQKTRTYGVIVALLSVMTIGTVIWSQQMKSAEHARWHAIREHLGTLIAEGTDLKQKCLEQAPPNKEAADWATRAEAFLDKELEHSYVIRFRSSSGLLPMSAPTGITAPANQELWEAINYRVNRLDEFSRELPW